MFTMMMPYLVAIACTASTTIVVFLNDVVASKHGEFGPLQCTPELSVARVSQVDRAQLGLVAYPVSHHQLFCF